MKQRFTSRDPTVFNTEATNLNDKEKKTLRDRIPKNKECNHITLVWIFYFVVKDQGFMEWVLAVDAGATTDVKLTWEVTVPVGLDWARVFN